ncbi:hypothetical protein [Microbacterium sp. 2RAF4]|uniref:hypothetical protein n=1 Tax=Microbacterium sp. 2RAF4 TaxID=3232999 RepID=UPI003F9DE31E
MSDPNAIPEVKTIAEVERIVNGSGLWDGTGVIEFSDDGVTWTPAWSPTDDIAHPQFARVAVHRKDVRIPTTAIIRWDEQFPEASEEWAGKWLRSPMRHFGRTVRMVAYRQTFRELLGNVRIEDEADDRVAGPVAAEATAPTEDRDWAAEFAAAETREQLDDLDSEARAAKVFKPNAAGTALHLALTTRRRALTATEPADAWTPAEHVAPQRPAPRDYLPPANRAERRKAARKKGGKR